jgi:nucleoside-diphosphate-sugar epimerase
MRRVLITGANGFLGRHLRAELSGSSWTVVPLVRRPCGAAGEVVADLAGEELPAVLAGLPEIDAVVHLGARTGWDGAPAADLFRPNVLATGLLADWARRRGAVFVFASAALVCGEASECIGAASAPAARHPYLVAKWLGEELIRASGVERVILRLAGVFGLGGPSHLGLNRVLAAAINGAVPRQCGTGAIRRNYLYVKDAGAIIRHCLDHAGDCVGVHLASGAEPLTMSAMLGSVCDVFLPGRFPEIVAGDGGRDQLIEPSPFLPAGRPFIEALRDIRADWHAQGDWR